MPQPKGYTGSEILSYTIKDRRGLEASSTATVTMAPESATPQYAGMNMVDDIFETVGDAPVVINPMDNDRHAKGWNMEMVSITNPEKGFASIDNRFKGEIYYVPSKNFLGEDHFVYELIDSRGYRSRAKITIRVIPQFDASRVNLTNVPDIDLKPVYFNYDDDNIRSSEIATMEANIALLKQNPEAVIKVVSHCDSRGNESHNFKLSTKRANSTVEYLVSHGVSEARIVAALGMVESDLTNDCGDGVDCPDSDHQENRRTVFTVIGTLR